MQRSCLVVCAAIILMARSEDAECTRAGCVEGEEVAQSGVLLQMQERAEYTKTVHDAEFLRQLDMQIVSHIKAFRSSPENVAQFLKQAVDMIMNAVVTFSQDPLPQEDIINGIKAMGLDLLPAVELLLPDSVKNAEYYSQFKTGWDDTFTNLVDDSTVLDAINAYTESAGDPLKLCSMIGTVVNHVNTVIELFIPTESSQEARKFTIGIREFFQGFADGMDELAAGRKVEATQEFYDGLRAFMDAVLPENVKGSEAYQIIITVVDEQVANLAKTVEAFQKKMMESKVCTKRSEHRSKIRPNQCSASGFHYDGVADCTKPVSRSLLQVEEMDTAVQGKNENKVEKLPATCDPGQPLEKMGTWCYKPCGNPDKLVPSANRHNCITKCTGRFPQEGTALFGAYQFCMEKPGIEVQINQRLIAAGIQFFSELTTFIVNIVQTIQNKDKVDIGQSMNTIIKTVVDFALALTFPGCEDGNHVGAGSISGQ